MITIPQNFQGDDQSLLYALVGASQVEYMG